MNTSEALQFLYSKLPMYQKVGDLAYKPGLQNSIKLSEALNNPHKAFKSIHIAGTNGKGSTSHYLAAIFQANGYKTGLYTSPHLKKFNERIKINGVEISDEHIATFVTRHLALIERTESSFFEVTTAMAFDWFAKNKVEVAIVETGLGGRLDATNILTPEITVITNIGYDHMGILGDTLEKIAFEKAGIIKPNIPVVISEYQPEIENVFMSKAIECNSAINYATDVIIQNIGITPFGRDIYIQSSSLFKEKTKITTGLSGIYQLKNLKGVIKAIEIAEKIGFKFTNVNIIKAILEVVTLTNLKGRWQIVNDKPLLVCDTGHNEAGIQEIIAQIRQTPHKSLWLIIGMVKEKNHQRILKLFPMDAHFIFTQPTIERAISAEKLNEIALHIGIKGLIIPDVNKAISHAMSLADKNDLIYVGGSTFTVAEVENL